MHGTLLIARRQHTLLVAPILAAPTAMTPTQP